MTTTIIDSKKNGVEVLNGNIVNETIKGINQIKNPFKVAYLIDFMLLDHPFSNLF